jgi:hypothetical protein
VKDRTVYYRLVDIAGVRGEKVLALEELAAELHSWYLPPDHPDVAEHPETRETLVRAHAAVDELLERLRRGEGPGDLADYLDLRLRRVRNGSAS